MVLFISQATTLPPLYLRMDNSEYKLVFENVFHSQFTVKVFQDSNSYRHKDINTITMDLPIDQ